jgi:recombination protein RecR
MSELDTLIQLLAKLPGLGPRSARRSALHLIKRRESLLEPLAAALAKAAEAIRPCPICGNLDTVEPCAICRDPERDATAICVVEDLADLWALERTGAFRGRYHVLGGTLSALDGVGPDDLNIERLLARIRPGQELIPALNATVRAKPPHTIWPIASRVEVSRYRDSPRGSRSAANSTTWMTGR